MFMVIESVRSGFRGFDLCGGYGLASGRSDSYCVDPLKTIFSLCLLVMLVHRGG
jgi:hypothetical protein